jgi:cytochrome c biogenesis protein ResB
MHIPHLKRVLWILAIFSIISWYFYQADQQAGGKNTYFDSGGFWADLLAIVMAEIIFVLMIEPLVKE